MKIRDGSAGSIPALGTTIFEEDVVFKFVIIRHEGFSVEDFFGGEMEASKRFEEIIDTEDYAGKRAQMIYWYGGAGLVNAWTRQ